MMKTRSIQKILDINVIQRGEKNNNIIHAFSSLVLNFLRNMPKYV